MYQKISDKRFVSLFVSIIAIFLLYHLLIWSFLTSRFFSTDPYYIGDLGRMSYQIGSLHPRIEQITLPLCHYDGTNWNNEPIDLITIGDSFSNGMGSGTNPYYQDFLATKLRINILNIQNIDDRLSYTETIRHLHQQGWLGKIRPKAILIESVARDVFNHGIPKNAGFEPGSEHLNSMLFNSKFTREFPKPLLINTANYKAPYYYLKYRYSARAKKEVYKLPLAQHLFSVPEPDALLVYHDDINSIQSVTESAVKQLNNELNLLADELRRDGIALIFMPAVDKYDLYYDELADKNSYPSNPFFPLLRKQPKRYLLVDTKAILRPLLDQRVPDVYYADDTHWSDKASSHITDDTVFAYLKDKSRP